MSETPSATLQDLLKSGGARVAEHSLNQAESDLRRALALDPRNASAWHLLGLALFKFGRWEEGVAHLRRSIELDGNNFAAWSDLAVAHREAGRAADADAAFAQAAKAPNAAQLWNSLIPQASRTFSTDDGFFKFKVVDYSYQAQVRYGGHRPPHPGLLALIATHRPNYESYLDAMGELRPVLHAIPLNGAYQDNDPFWLNTWFPPLDGMALYTMLRHHRPARLLEIGSGNSTKYARRAVTEGGLATRITSIDPEPRAQIDALCDRVVRSKLEDCGAEEFASLEAGDILFLDSSHRAFQNSDVTVFFLEILPVLKPGVIVHLHDIYLPYDYPRGHLPRLWNEQYLLATALLFGGAAFEILFPSWYIARDAALAAKLNGLMRTGPLSGLSLHGFSFWLRKT